METHPSILAWEITWTKEPGGLQAVDKDMDMTERLSTKVVSKKFIKGIFKRVENI